MNKDDVMQGLGFIDENDSMDGFDINSSNISIPTLKLAQDGHDQVKKQKPEYIEGLEPGMFFNDVTGEIYGETVNLVVLKMEHVFIEYKPDRGGFVEYHTPENAQRVASNPLDWKGKWVRDTGNAEPNTLAETFIYVVLVEGHEKEGPLLLYWQRSAIKVGESWNRLMITHIMPNGQKALPYYLVWNMSSFFKEADKGDYFSYKVKFDHYIKEEMYLSAKEERKALVDKTINYAQLEDQTKSNEVDESTVDY